MPIPQQRESISIHALREEGDQSYTNFVTNSNTFLSTPSARRATYMPEVFHDVMKFLSTPSARRATKDAPKAS